MRLVVHGCAVVLCVGLSERGDALGCVAGQGWSCTALLGGCLLVCARVCFPTASMGLGGAIVTRLTGCGVDGEVVCCLLLSGEAQFHILRVSLVTGQYMILHLA